jgi:hypothetical protein
MKSRHRCNTMAPQEPCHDEVLQPCLQRDKGGEVDPMHAAPPLVHFYQHCLCMGVDFPSFGGGLPPNWCFLNL